MIKEQNINQNSQLKRKKVTDVYTKEVIEKEVQTIKDEELNSYITYKHVNKISNPVKVYINGRKVTLFDENYTILEYSPCDELYNARLFIDDKGNIMMYYFDIVSNFEFTDEGIYYNDLYLDVTYNMSIITGVENYITLEDAKELSLALSEKIITKEQYDKAYEVAERIMDELRNNKNKFVNRGIKDYLKFIDNKK